MNRRVVVTGIGAVTPLGMTAEQTWESMRQAVCGIAAVSSYDASAQATCLAAEVKGDLAEHLAASDMRKMDRFAQLAVVAAREAIADSGLLACSAAGDAASDAAAGAARIDVVVSSGIGGMATTVREHVRGTERGFDRISPYYIPMTIANIAAGRIAIEHGLKGDCSCIVTACASSAHALGEAMRHVRHGYADAVVCGGSEATVIPLAMGGFTSMQALHVGADVLRASIPFDAQRSGFVLGEGAGIVVLEEYQHARARGAHIYAELCGFGATCDAYHITAPDPEGTGAINSMRRALADAGLAPGDIGYINAHGTSTQLNDKSEATAIHAVFNNGSLPPVSSTKSMTGHLLGAAGAVEAIACVRALEDRFLPPTINYRVPDPACDLDVVPNEGRDASFDAVLSNSLGFGGHNASLVFARC
ncbi:MAG: beta-ketoacyl-ACP synthase II [Coriobacteriales bacterium]|jgi:3-oxoacyl-[acyl-carrier-protein] synthase II|nr:beta-ketoacyl-ACP synthase II [Coriobacteriales bacterium]